ncbi:VanZ family protein [Pelagibacterium lentulum]|nr:VanZ family protein [Pelagibacterium lentulum]
MAQERQYAFELSTKSTFFRIFPFILVAKALMTVPGPLFLKHGKDNILWKCEAVNLKVLAFRGYVWAKFAKKVLTVPNWDSILDRDQTLQASIFAALSGQHLRGRRLPTGRRMIRRFLFWASLALIAIIVAASVIPGTWRPHTPLRTTVEHFLAYGLVAFWFAVILDKWWHKIVLALALVALSVVLELAQTAIPGRGGELIDIYYSAAGVLVGTGSGMALVWGQRWLMRQVRRTGSTYRP